MDPVFQVLDNLVEQELYRQACDVCAGKRWYFGHGSHNDDALPFWKMDLDGDVIFDAIWREARERCEALAGGRLRVLRQYANGHTYGLGGKPHLDDNRPGSFTLLYYPMPEWKDAWEGESVFYGEDGEVAAAVRPRANRAVFFDSRIPHAGRAPGRSCPALRVTVAFKLELEAAPAEALEEIESEGARRIYRARVPEERVTRLVAERLEERAKTLKLPGFRPGKIPAAVMEQRYGAKTRGEAAGQLAAEVADRLYASGSLASAVEVESGKEAGALVFRIEATHMPNLPPLDFASLAFERVTADQSVVAAAGLSPDQGAEVLREHLNQQVLDFLDAHYSFAVARALVEREFAKLWKAAEAELSAEAADKEAAAAELRVIAERRVRLGAVVLELARRYGIPTDTEVERHVVEYLVERARITERVLDAAELRELV